MENEIQWICKPFEKLTTAELYAILQLRIDVFIVEQNCIFQDADDKDQVSYHMMAWSDEKLAGYTRLIPPGISYKEASIGRVATFPKMRKSGIGKKIMARSIDQIYALWGIQPIRIGAQLYLKNFYESFGFQQCSEIYIEDNIEHIQMILQSP